MWNNGRHPPMPPRERAKQFLPFAAVVGLEEALKEKERLYERRAELSCDMEEELDRRLRALTAGERLRLAYFTGERYASVLLTFVRVDPTEGTLLSQELPPIPLADIRTVDSENTQN